MRGLRIVSYAMAGAALTLSVLYLGPAVLVQRSGVGPQVTLVQIIDEIVPVSTGAGGSRKIAPSSRSRP